MKRFSLTALSAGLGLTLLSAPLAMAQQYNGAHRDAPAHHVPAPVHRPAPHTQMGHGQMSYRPASHVPTRSNSHNSMPHGAMMAHGGDAKAGSHASGAGSHQPDFRK